MPGVPPPQPTPSPDTWVAAPDPNITVVMLGLLLLVPMFMCLFAGVDEIAKWLEARKPKR